MHDVFARIEQVLVPVISKPISPKKNPTSNSESTVLLSLARTSVKPNLQKIKNIGKYSLIKIRTITFNNKKHFICYFILLNNKISLHANHRLKICANISYKKLISKFK